MNFRKSIRLSYLDSIRHIVDNKSLEREDVINYLDRLADTVLEFDSVTFHYYGKGNSKVPGLLFKKNFADGTLFSFDLVSNNKRSLVLQTLYMDSATYQKRKSAKTLPMQNANSNTSKTQVGQTSKDSITPTEPIVNTSDGRMFSLRNNTKTTDINAETDNRDQLTEYAVQEALYDSLDHADKGDDNLVRISRMPKYIVDLIGIDGDFYIYRNHAYENMVSEERAKEDGRFNRKAHYHDLGMEMMTDAIMSLNNPIMTISTKSKEGNPTVIMLLPVFGKNNAPLYAVLSFYSNKPINGDLTTKPHIVLTISERNFFEDGGRTGISDVVKSAITDGRVLDFDKKRKEDLSVIAKSAGLGNITEPSLKESLAYFKKFVNTFREKNRISYSLRNRTQAVALLERYEKGEITKYQNYRCNKVLLWQTFLFYLRRAFVIICF